MHYNLFLGNSKISAKKSTDNNQLEFFHDGFSFEDISSTLLITNQFKSMASGFFSH